ncbi:MAG: hypothetical protein CVV47_03335 [Spirochaetae bacterium HGW-Spirochaetae-3]|jgi:hypothetical protein|nr:MAG: hypothetical protein CVV47_03335 [Spirochaetae bacterium HGW-Spirochaetae-3]
MITKVTRILVTLGSSVSIGFGLWHFFVPKAWNWYSYIDARATELIVAVRAVNFFFSLSLVLFGLMNVFMILGNGASRYPLLVCLGANCVLWFARVLFQFMYPQGSIQPILQFSMLSSFIITFSFYAAALLSVVLDGNPG